MTILFRYILREYAKIFLMCFAGLMTIYMVIDFFEKVRRFLRYDSGVVPMLTYFALKIPAISFQVVPFAVLVATLLTLGLLSRSNEITALRSSGISLLWVTSPFLILAGGLAVILLAFSSTIIPLASGKAEEVRMIQIEKKPVPLTVQAPQPWARIGTDALMRVTTIDVGGKTLRGVRLFYFNQTFRLDQVVEAAEAQYAASGWVLRNGTRRQFALNHTVDLTLFTDQPADIPLIPDDFSTTLTGNSDTMTFREIRNYIGRFQHEEVSFARLLTDYYGRMAFPFVTIIMVLIGIALSLRRSGVRGGSMAMGIGQAFIVGFCYWTTHSIAIALGRGGAMAPMFAGWMANILFGSFGLYLLLKVRH
ncbi:MAG: LPS export ABC transporter permease LptG [Nitrospira sp.]|nr:LPS export ABC transporter permease LptG [Nitrospira sp.]MDH4327987.1 LPS export ABC transporter permease LptG [Nitrospira sp.]